MTDHSDLSGAAAPAAPLASRGAPVWQVTLWPHRSLPRQGFRALILGASLVMLLPLLWAVGSQALWFILPFVLLDVGLLWFFLRLNYRDGRITEHLQLWPDLIRVDRHEPDGTHKVWEANPYWLRLSLREDAKVEQYLTLKGNGREIELGAFLSPEERVSLKREIEVAVARLGGMTPEETLRG